MLKGEWRLPKWTLLSLFAGWLAVTSLAFFYGRNLARVAAVRASKQSAFSSVQTAAVPLAGQTVATTSHALAAGIDLDQRWNLWTKSPRSPALSKQAENALEEMAQSDPARAMALAEAQGAQFRGRFRSAVLRGWASVAPGDAAEWAMRLPNTERREAIGAVFAGAAAKPDAAASLASKLCAASPVDAADYGQMAVTALGEAGAFRAAWQFAAKGAPEMNEAWLNSSFYQWSLYRPEEALKALAEVSAPAARNAAFAGLVTGWAESNPDALATYAVQLLPGSGRAQALDQTLKQWATRDPAGASEWMLKHFESSPDLDGGVAAVATLPSLVSQRPEVAIGWAENIADPAVRSATLLTVAQLWTERDAGAVQHFLASTPALSEEERAAFAKALQETPGQ